jgi:hypothetical protein
MPDFNELVKNLYTSKNRELTQEKLDYIKKTYTGKEEDFVKNFYATVGEELPQEKLDYISNTYLSKKAPAVPSFSTDMSNTLPIIKDSPLQANVDKAVKEPIVPAMPKAFSMPKEKAIVDKDPIGRTNLYKSTVDNITKRISNNLLIADDLGKKGDGQGMQNIMTQINQDQKKIESLNKGIEAQRVIAEDMGYNTKGESALRGIKSTLGLLLTSPEGYDESISAIERSLYGMVGIDTGKMTKDIIEWKEKTEKELGKPIGVEEMRLSDELAVIGRKILEQTGKEKSIANLGSKYGGDVIKLVKSGDVSEIVSQGVNSFLENAPTSLAFLNPYTATGVVGGMMNEQITEAKSEGKEIGAQVVAAGAIKAALEFATENMMGGGKVVKDLITSLGKGAAEKVVKESIEKMIKEGFFKKYGKAISEEILGEVTNQIGSNAVDIYMNGKKDVKLSDGISDAAFAAIFSSGIQTAPALLAQKYVDKKAIASSQEKKAQAAKLMESAVSQPTQAAQDAIEEKAQKLEVEANKEIDNHVEIAKKATDEDLAKIDNLDTSIDEIGASINENSDPEVIAILEDKKQELEKERTNTIKEIEKRPAPSTKFYQGVDFKAQTGLPNGDYTEEQVKAARENKLKEAGVTPAEIETINAEQEIIPATETPAAPISGVSGEVQASGDVEAQKADIEKRRQEELKRITLEELKKELKGYTFGLIPIEDKIGNSFRISGVDENEIYVNFITEDGNNSNFAIPIQGNSRLIEKYKNAEWSDSDINDKYNAELSALTNKQNETENRTEQSTNEANGEVVLEGVREAGNEDEIGKSSEQLREEEVGSGVESKTNKLESKLPNFESNTRSQSTKDLIAWAEDIFDTKFEGDFNKGEYVSFFNSLGDKGYEAARFLQNPKKALSILKESPTYLGKVKEQSTKETGLTNEELLSNLPSSRDNVNNAPVSITDPNDKSGNKKTRYIPFSIIEKAQKNDRLGGQTAREIAQRGGYSDRELDALYPNWRKEIAESNKPKSEAQDAFNENNAPVAEVKEQAPVVKEQAAPPVKAEEKEDKEQKEPVKEQAPVIEAPKLEMPVVEETVTEPTAAEEEEEQYEPITVSDTSHDTFTKDNAVDYEEGEREGDNGRSYTYLASVTVELIDDVGGETLGTISKLKDEDGEITWSAETNDGDQVADEVGSKAEAQQALVDNFNKQKLKEFNKEKAKAAKEKIKEAEKAKKKADKEAEKAAKAAEKATKAVKKSKPEQIGAGLLDLLGIAPEETDVKFSKVSVGKINWSESKIGKGDRAITERNDNVKNAAEDLYQGRIGLDEYNDIVDENSPIEPITEFIEPAKEEDIRVAVGDKSEGKINLDFPKGKKVGLRLDIPAYINKNIWAITVHEDGKTGSPLSYNNVARIKNVEFTSDPKVALDIARQKELSSGKKMGKATIARMMGEWMPIEGSNGELKGEAAMKMIDDIKNNPEWAQIGMNPFRHSFFYDRATGNPVVAAEEVIQIGGLVYAKNIETASKNDERFIVNDAKGNPIIGKEGKAVRFSKKEKSGNAILSEVEQEQEIVDQMNKMNLVNEGIDLNPSFTTKETIDVTELNSRLDTPLKAVNWAQFKGIPFGFTISDQLRTGDIELPSTGATIDNLKGGIGFNGTEGNETNAWANTDLSSSASMYSKALEMYNNNKPLFEKLWKEGKLPAGHVPFAVVKMAETSIISNEAIRRVGIENLKTLPEANRKEAVVALKSEIERKRKQEAEDLVRGTKLKKVKGTPKGVTEYIDTKIPYSKNTAKAKDKIIKQYESILASLDKNNYEDIVDVLKNTDDFTLPAKAVIFNEIFYGDPNKIGQPSKNPGTPSTLVSQTLVKGLDKSKRRLISIGVITDLITEPSMINVPNMHVISVIGVKVAEENKNGKWVKAGGSTSVDHPNYKYGVEGQSVGVLTNPVHMKDAFGEAYGSVLGQIVKNEAEKASISIDNLLVQGIPVQAGLPNLVFKSAIASGELDAVDKLAGFLRQAFPSTTFFTSEDAWDAAMEDPSVKKKLKDGDVVYAFTTNGNVFINPTLKTTKAALHETGHIWMSFVKENNPALYAKGLQLVTNTREHQKAIKEYGDTELAREEALMELMSSKGDTIVRASDKAKFKEWLLSVYKYVADNFTSLLGLTPKQIENLTLDKFLEGMLADILSGKKVTTKKVKAEKEVKFSLESQNSKIRDYIEKQREAGESDKDIRAGVEMVADKLGLTEEDINNLMSENESPTATTEQAEFTPNAKDIKAFEKILGTTSGAIRNKNIAEAVKVNPKIQEIMDNFDELKKQLMASVELTEDCSW